MTASPNTLAFQAEAVGGPFPKSHMELLLMVARAIERERERDKWRPIETADLAQQYLVWEPMYGWLIAAKNDDGWRLKSSGNYWMGCPREVTFSHFQPLPSPPAGGAQE